MVSIIITMIMMIVITLIVLGFGTVARRNSREALDRQLSSQAYYAAETGVNDVQAIVNANPSAGASPAYNSNCSAFMGANNLSGTLSATNNVSYTCLLVNELPPSIVTTVGLGSQKVYPITPTLATPLTFTWQAAETTGNFDGSTCPANATASAWVSGTNGTNGCPYGILRVDIFDGTGADSDTMAAHTGTVYMYPSNNGSGAASVQFGTLTTVAAVCNAGAQTCSTTLTLPGGASFPANTTYYARVSNIYESSGQVTIMGTGGADFQGAQTLIDATGKAQDEIQRIQVHAPINPPTSLPAINALSSAGAICKRFTVQGANTSDTSNTSNPLCNSN